MLSKPQKRVVLGTTILIILVLFVLPAINVSRFRLSVARSLSQALGREVTVQGISIQTFPQPGLLLNGVSVADDPSISAEPMLRADEVLATLRISSLWRGRLEIGTLKLSYPSVNLARSNDGRWNLESLLERARETPSAPTAKPRPETRPRFPYIEADGGRINLKLGNEKKSFALNDADFAVWMASEDEWRMRLEARPIRTDANLSDTGTVKMVGSWRRAPQLHETPIQINYWWDNGQLGQITHLIYGRDRGWRGTVHISGSISGKPEDLAARLDARVEDFRRYDILSGDSLSLELHCTSDYNFTSKQIGNIGCQLPAGSGTILARGSYDFIPRPHIDLSLTAENLPMQFVALLARHAKRDLPSDMNVTGMLSAALAVRGDWGNHIWAGNGQVSDVEIRSTVLSKPLVLGASRWSLVGPGIEPPFSKRTAIARKLVAEELPHPSSLAWQLQPVSLKLGGAAPTTLAGWYSREGYYMEVRGDAELDRLFELSKLAGLPTPAAEVSGTAKGAIQISGEWAGFARPTITGDAQLKTVTARFNGVSSPLKISAAHFTATPSLITVSKAVGSFTAVRGALSFSAFWPQHCQEIQGNDPFRCGMQFNVAADQLNIDEVNSLLNPRAQKRPWYAALANSVIGSQRTKFPSIYAQGQVSAAKLEFKSATASHVSSTLSITPAGFALTSIKADLFGGKYLGEIRCDLTSGIPAYTSSGNLQKIAMQDVATIMKDSWASGVANVDYHGSASGWSADDLLSAAAGSASFTWLNGALPHVELDSVGKPLLFKRFTGTADLVNGTLSLRNGALTAGTSKAQSGTSIYLVSGTASLGRRLELKLTRDGNHAGYSITGTLEKPTIAPLRVSATQAKLSGETSTR